MERVIRFRGKRLDNKEWAFGQLVYFYDAFGDRATIIKQGTGERGIINPHYPADPATVGQFIGRKDRYGKEIYEGDILDFYDDECGKPGNLCGARLEIKWNKEESHFGYQNHVEGHEYVSGFKRLWDEDTYVIIGNIYDNPELLDVEND